MRAESRSKRADEEGNGGANGERGENGRTRLVGTGLSRGDGGGLNSMNDDGDSWRGCAGASGSLPLPSATRRKLLLEPPEPDPCELRSEVADVPRYSRANEVEAHVP